MNWSEQVVLVTGGTGSFGKKFVEIMLREHLPQKLIIFSRDELKQHDMAKSGLQHPCLRYFLGDVRDADRLRRALSGVTVVVHAAALKQVPACEYNPFEAIQTNIIGGRNVIDAALDQGVQRIMALSTDKAVNPINLYGATKLCAEKMFVQANAYAGQQNTRFSCVRYGNVVGSRGSVVPILLEQRKRGKITLTDARMSRFWSRRFALPSVASSRCTAGKSLFPRSPACRCWKSRKRWHRIAKWNTWAFGPAKNCTRFCFQKTKRAIRSTYPKCMSFSPRRTPGGAMTTGRTRVPCPRDFAMRATPIPSDLPRIS